MSALVEIREALLDRPEACGASPNPELRPERPGVSILSAVVIRAGSEDRLCRFKSQVCH